MNHVQKFRERRGIAQCSSPTAQHREPGTFEPQGNGDGRHGAEHTLVRLGREEQDAFVRLQTALQGTDRFQIDACQTYWLKVAETLRRSDASIDLARRQAEVQVPLRQAEDAVLFVAEWLRIAIATFLSSETTSLMAFRDGGEFRNYFWSGG